MFLVRDLVIGLLMEVDTIFLMKGEVFAQDPTDPQMDRWLQVVVLEQTQVYELPVIIGEER